MLERVISVAVHNHYKRLEANQKGEGKTDIDERVVTRYSEAIQKTESSDHARLIGKRQRAQP